MDPDEELQDAARRGDLALAQHAVQQGADCHAESPIGLCALHFAAQNGHDLLCELLLSEGADVSPRDKHGRTPIQLAAVRGHEAVVELLVAHGAELTDDLEEKMEAAVFKRKHRVQHIHSIHEGDIEAARAAQRRRERIERQRHRKRLGRQQPTSADDDVAERDTKQVVDWWSAPQKKISQVSRMYARPTYVNVADERTNGTGTKRVPFDKVDALVDESGWPKAQTRNGDSPAPYPCLCISTPCTGKGMDSNELGDIGGPGLRLYFFLLSFLYTAFFVMAVLSTPSVVLNSADSMYNHSEAGRYSSGMAETTLGNVKMELTTLASGELFGHKLWAISTLEAVGSVVMLVMVLRASGRMNKIVKEVDRSGCTMGDYTVMVSPAGNWSFYAGVGKQKQKHLIEDVEATLEREIAGSQIAEISGEPCIWVAWDEDDVITLWRQKTAELRKLESALNDAYKGDAESTLKVLARLDDINERIRDIGDTKSFTPVFVFATFQTSDHYEEAIARSEPVVIGEMQCELLPAPEPGTLVWEHLQVSAKTRKRRKCCTNALTALALMIGAALILYANNLKAGVRYIDNCADVMGPDKLYDDVCPLPIDPTTTALVAADRNGLSERTVENYRSKFISVSNAAGRQFPLIDTEEIQNKLALPVCGVPSPDTCENDPHGFLRFAGTSCSDMITLSSATSSADYMLMSQGELTCPSALEIMTVEECEAAYDFMDATENFNGARGMQYVSSPDIPVGCSVQQPAGSNEGASFDSSPHWNTFSGNATGVRGETGEFLLLCKHWNTLAGCDKHLIPNTLQVRDVCPLSCGVPATECRDDTNRFTTRQGFVRTNDCHYMDAGMPNGPAEFLMQGGDVDAMCYACLCTLETVASQRVAIETWFAGDADVGSEDLAAVLERKMAATKGGFCEPIDKKVTEAATWGTVAAIIVVVINQVLRRCIKASAVCLKAHTIETQMVSTALRVYVCQVLNTAILMLIFRSNFWIFGSLPGEHYDTVNAKWYATVGTPLIQTMIVQFITPLGVHLFMYTIGSCKRSCVSRAKTQHLLNAAFSPTSFDIAAGYGEILLAATVTLLFGAGIPLLYHVAAVGFFVRYLVERWVIVRVAKRPPLYSKQLFESFDEVFALLLLVHAAMAVYFMSSAGGEEPSSYIFLKAPWDSMHSHVWPTFFSFVCVSVGVVYKFGRCACVVERRESRSAKKQLKERQRRKNEKMVENENAALDAEAPKESDSSDEDEQNPDFTVAYTEGLLINEDDDYEMDLHEDLLELEAAFIEAIEDQRSKRQEPFDDAGFYRRCRAAVQPQPDEDLAELLNDDGASRYVEAQKEKKQLREKTDGNKDVEKAFRELLRARESGNEDAILKAENRLKKETDEAVAAIEATKQAEKAAKVERRERARQEKARTKSRKDAEKALRSQKAIIEQAQAAAAAAQAAKEQEDIEQAEIELELAQIAGDPEQIAAAEQKLREEKEQATAAAAHAETERAEALKVLQDNVEAAEEVLRKAQAEVTKWTGEAESAAVRANAEHTKIDEIHLSIVTLEKKGDLDAIQAEETRLAKEKEIAREAQAASPRARAQLTDAQRAQEDAEVELAAAQSALSQYEAHLLGVSQRVAKVKRENEKAKSERKAMRAQLRTVSAELQEHREALAKEQAEADDAALIFEREEEKAVEAEQALKQARSALADAQKVLRQAEAAGDDQQISSCEQDVDAANATVADKLRDAEKKRANADAAKAAKDKETREAKEAARTRQQSERQLAKIRQMEEKDIAKNKKRQEKEAARLKQMLAAEEQVVAVQGSTPTHNAEP